MSVVPKVRFSGVPTALSARILRVGGGQRFFMSETASMCAFESDFARLSSRFSLSDLAATVFVPFFFGDLSDMAGSLGREPSGSLLLTLGGFPRGGANHTESAGNRLDRMSAEIGFTRR
jgi:hypothetical protein